jgi:adenylosuccinate lyase
VDDQKMLENIELTKGRGMSEAVMTALIRKGMNRQEAHELLRKLTLKSESAKQSFKETLLDDTTVRKILSEREVDEALNPRNYLGTAKKQVELMVKTVKKERGIRGL